MWCRHTAYSEWCRRKRISIIRIIFSSWQVFFLFLSRTLFAEVSAETLKCFQCFSKVIALKCFAYRESGSENIVEIGGVRFQYGGTKTIKYWNKIHLPTSETAATCFKSLWNRRHIKILHGKYQLWTILGYIAFDIYLTLWSITNAYIAGVAWICNSSAVSSVESNCHAEYFFPSLAILSCLHAINITVYL